jgi:TPR repeat protein
VCAALIGLAVQIILVASKDGVQYLAHISVLVNLAACVWLLFAGIGILSGSGKKRAFQTLAGSRIQGALVTYLIAASLIFWIAFAGHIPPFSPEWFKGEVAIAYIYNNAVLPLFMLAVWLFYPTDKKRMQKNDPFYWLVVPYLYFMVILIVALAAKTYVYEFIDPIWVEAQIGVNKTINLLWALAVAAGLGLLFYYLGRFIITLRHKQLAGAARQKTVDTLVLDESAESETYLDGVVGGVVAGGAVAATDEETAEPNYVNVEVEQLHVVSAAAQNGDAVAQLIVGVCNEKGLGSDVDYAEAAKWYAAATGNGNADAANNLANCYATGKGVEKNPEQAVSLYIQAAEQGNADALYNLGNCYYSGFGVGQDYEKAAGCYLEAAEKGSPKAQNNISDCYEKGYGVAKNQAEADKWKKKAAESGYKAKQAGICKERAGYPDGADISESAAGLYEARADMGDADALLVVGVSREKGLGVERDYEQAVKSYEKAAKKGNADAENNLGVLYAVGYGVKKDEKKAYKEFAKAAEQGNANGRYNLGNCYYFGWGVTQDYEKAAKLYADAAGQGHAKAQNNLAYCYENGHGVTPNPEKAAALYAQAAEKGEAYADKRLGICNLTASYPDGADVAAVKDAIYGREVREGILVAADTKPTDDAAIAEETAKAAEQAAIAAAAETQAAETQAAEAQAAIAAAAEQAEIIAAAEAAKAEEEAQAAKAAEEEAIAAEAAEEARQEAAAAAVAVEEAKRAAEAAEEEAEAIAAEEAEARRIAEQTAAAALKEKSADDEEDAEERPIMEIPDGWMYQDGWYYVSETGERVEIPAVHDEYYHDLPEELKSEFRDLFIDGGRVSIPRFPFYVIDGDNTMFFRLVFTFITRYRKIISIALLENLYNYLVEKFGDNPIAISRINDKLIRIYFTRRKEEGILDKCEAKCREDIDYCLKYVQNYPANLYSFKRLTMILERGDRLYEARALCKKAIEIGLVDGTKAGYAGRLERIERRIQEEEDAKKETPEA